MGHIGHVGRVVQFLHRPIAHMDMIDHGRRGGDQFDIVFAFHPVADHLKVQQPKEPTAKTKAKGSGCFHFVGETRVVQRQFFDRVAQVFEFRAVHREQPAKHHGDRRFETGKRNLASLFFRCDRVTNAGVTHLFDLGRDESDFTGAKFINILHGRAIHPDTVNVIGPAGAHHLDPLPFFQDAGDHPHNNDNPQVRVID